MTLSWADVSSAGEQAEHGRSVVVHEFIHKIDMQTGQANGCPALPCPALLCPAQSGCASALTAGYEGVLCPILRPSNHGPALWQRGSWAKRLWRELSSRIFCGVGTSVFCKPKLF